MVQTKNNNRIDLVDAMRAVAIVLVLLSHYNGGRLSIFANRGCVQMFFFISGMFAFTGRYNLRQYVKKQAQSLMLPYVIFAAVNIAFHLAFNPSTSADELMGFAVNFILARRNNVMVAAMWFLPCLFFASILYKCMATLLKQQKYIAPVCFVISAVFKIWFEDPVYIFSLNQGLKYLIYLALGGALYPYIKQISDDSWKKLSPKQRAAAIFAFIMILYYIRLLYKRGYVFWPQAIWALSLVYFINVVVIIVFVIILSVILSRVKPFVWAGQNTLGFCCLENINRALLNTAMAVVGFGFVPDSALKAFVHVIASMCIGSVIIMAVNKICPQILGKKRK